MSRAKLNGTRWRALVGHEPRPITTRRYPADFEPERTEPQVVKWRQTVLGPDGPPSATTRHVLLTLGTHMNDSGGSCFPSVDLLAKESRLSKRAILRHIHFAEEEGWIEITPAMGHGKGYRRNEYQATVPVFVGERQSPRRKHPHPRESQALNGGEREDASR